jgi:hypothetical protein
MTTHFHVLSTDTPLAHPFGTVYTRLAPDSYVAAPLLPTLMNLYSKLVPAGMLIVVYLFGDSAGTDAVLQLPSCAIDPAILTVWPKVVVVFELNVTATVGTSVAHAVGTAVEEGFVDDVCALLEVGGVELPEPVPVILM